MKRILFVLIIILSINDNLLAADENNHFETAKKLVELIYNQEASYQEFMFWGSIPFKERVENNPNSKEYSEIIINVFEDIMSKYFYDPTTQKLLKDAYAGIYADEFTNNELLELIRFYKTNLGQKILQKNPLLLQRSRQKEAELIQGPIFSKYMQMFTERLDELKANGTLPKDFNQ